MRGTAFGVAVLAIADNKSPAWHDKLKFVHELQFVVLRALTRSGGNYQRPCS